MIKDILIVDGYNVIFGWSHLKKMAHHNLEHARVELRNQLLNYGKYKGFEIVLVFDGLINGKFASSERVTTEFLEVYTTEGETADSYIEREVYNRKGKYTNVYVVTSDGAEQNQILGSGGLRIPARELQNNIHLAKEEERKQYTQSHNRDEMRIRRNELGNLLDPKVAEQLELIRRGNK